jgi:type II secretory pathway component GspD/PulD (secretin)
MMLVLCGAAQAGPEALDARIDIDLEKADVLETLESFGKVLQAEEISVDPELAGTVSIRLDGVRVRTVLDALCESVGCEWSFEGGVFRAWALAGEAVPASGLDAPINLALEDAPARPVLESFGRILRAEVKIDAEVGGTVTVELEEVPAREALDRVCERVGCRWTLDEGPEGRVLRIEAR